MKKIIPLILIIFSAISYSKEIKTSDYNTNLMTIKIGSFSTLNSALSVVNTLSHKYDILTLKDSVYSQYIVNIVPASYNEILVEVKKNYPNADKIKALSIKTDAIILHSTADNLIDSQNEPGKPVTENFENATPFPKNKKMFTDFSIKDKNLTQRTNLEINNTKNLNTSIQNNIQVDIPTLNINLELNKIKDITNTNVDKSEISTLQDKKVQLIDVVLQTISTSNKVMSSREKMIQAKRNVDIAFANFYPSVDASYTLGKSELRPGETNNGVLDKAKYYGDEIYSLTVTQNVYAGGETKNNVEQLKADYLVAKIEFEKLLEDESLKAINSYIDVVFSRDALEADKQNIEELERILEIVTIKYDAGALSTGELSNIQASVSNAKSQLSRTTSRHENALDYFKFIVGESFQNTYPYEKVMQVTLKDFNSLLDSSLKKNNSLRAFKYNILSSKYNLKKLKSPFRPKVDFIAGVNRISDQEDFVNVEDRQYVKMVLSYNLFNGGKDEATYLKAYSILQEKTYDKEAEIRKIKWNLEKFYTSLTSLQSNISNVENEVNASRSMVGSYWESFKLGEQDLYILLQAQRQLNTAELAFIQTQQDSMKDYFEILRLLGDLLDYFCIDIDDANYLDMAKANYRTQNSIIATIDKIEPKTAVINESPIIKEEIENDVEEEKIKKSSSLETLLSFNESFLLQNSTHYTIVISKLSSPVDALKVISNLDAEDKAFMYEFFENKKVKTNIAYGIFSNKQEAKQSMSTELQKFDNLTIQRVGKVQNDFRDYFKLSFLNADEVAKRIEPPHVTKAVEIPFTTNRLFQKEFLSAPQEFFTINITTLSSMEMAKRVVKDANIEKNSFAFSFGPEGRWIKLMMGVYPTYDEAKAALNAIGDIKTKYNPVIEKISLKQELYKRFNQQ